ncbi:ATP-binding protein [Micromonospora sp. NPDC049900]|uniref:ATP-binding protein n=1 Tax=Micromonospora sp. NPDC049900 TaxID=3364275 RepID=UPI0037957D34
MRISRLTIDKLGIKLYDRVTAVLAELIANSYDADAEAVDITLPWNAFLSSAAAGSGPAEVRPVLDTTTSAENVGLEDRVHPDQMPLVPFEQIQAVSQRYEIVISDNGHGMTDEELNRHYLSVGADRRKRTGSDKSRSKLRPVMGRKGIGKLAPFGICQTVEVITAGGEKTPNGWRVSHIVLRLTDIIADTDEEYNPAPGPLDGSFSDSSGTVIKLRDFFRKKVPSRDELDRQLSARFGISRDDWVVTIQDSLNSGDPFQLGSLKIDYLEDTCIDLADRPVPFGDSFLPVTGFVAFSRKPYKDPAMAGVRVYARGKIVAQTRDFDIGAGFTGEYKMRSYLVGELHAEWLDEEDDLVRSDRQDILWSSDQGEALKNWGQKLIRELGKRAEKAVRNQTWKDFERKSDLKKRLDQAAPSEPELRESVTEAAKLLVKDLDPEALNNQDHVDQIANLAISIGPHRTLLGTLREVAETTATTIDAVMALFHRARLAEMYSLGQVAEERLEVISKLEELISDGTTLERPLQELIEQAPWLLSPEWTPLGMNESLKRVRGSFEAWYAKNYGEMIVTSAIENPKREPDFVMLNDAGQLWIVEIKRLRYQLTDYEYGRGIDYLQALTSFLDANPELGRHFPIRRLTFVVDHIDRLGAVALSSLKSDSRVAHQTWHGLLDLTKRAHKDFLAKVAAIKVGSDATTLGISASGYSDESAGQGQLDFGSAVEGQS